MRAEATSTHLASAYEILQMSCKRGWRREGTQSLKQAPRWNEHFGLTLMLKFPVRAASPRLVS